MSGFCYQVLPPTRVHVDACHPRATQLQAAATLPCRKLFVLQTLGYNQLTSPEAPQQHPDPGERAAQALPSSPAFALQPLAHSNTA